GALEEEEEEKEDTEAIEKFLWKTREAIELLSLVAKSEEEEEEFRMMFPGDDNGDIILSDDEESEEGEEGDGHSDQKDNEIVVECDGQEDK
ncbi:hypothetical protein JG687_00014741, partial [Phytophthora cactorum]